MFLLPRPARSCSCACCARAGRRRNSTSFSAGQQLQLQRQVYSKRQAHHHHQQQLTTTTSAHHNPLSSSSPQPPRPHAYTMDLLPTTRAALSSAATSRSQQQRRALPPCSVHRRAANTMLTCQCVAVSELSPTAAAVRTTTREWLQLDRLLDDAEHRLRLLQELELMMQAAGSDAGAARHLHGGECLRTHPLWRTTEAMTDGLLRRRRRMGSRSRCQRETVASEVLRDVSAKSR